MAGWSTVAGSLFLAALGTIFIAAGLPVLLDSFGRFALQGLGTPAPIFPTQHLAVVCCSYVAKKS